jgi:hypothetical protein
VLKNEGIGMGHFWMDGTANQVSLSEQRIQNLIAEIYLPETSAFFGLFSSSPDASMTKVTFQTLGSCSLPIITVPRDPDYKPSSPIVKPPESLSFRDPLYHQHIYKLSNARDSTRPKKDEDPDSPERFLRLLNDQDD